MNKFPADLILQGSRLQAMKALLSPQHPRASRRWERLVEIVLRGLRWNWN